MRALFMNGSDAGHPDRGEFQRPAALLARVEGVTAPHTVHAGSRGILVMRHSPERASMFCTRLGNDCPMPTSSLNVSMACAAPTTPVSGAKTPIVRALHFLHFGVLGKEARVTRRVWFRRSKTISWRVEADRRSGHQRLLCGDAGAVDRVARGEVVGAVEHHIGARHGSSKSSVTRLWSGTISTSGFTALSAAARGVDLDPPDRLACDRGSGAAGW